MKNNFQWLIKNETNKSLQTDNWLIQIKQGHGPHCLLVRLILMITICSSGANHFLASSLSTQYGYPVCLRLGQTVIWSSAPRDLLNESYL